MYRLTELQARLLRALQRQNEDEGIHLSALANAFGIHVVTLREHLDALARKGYVEVQSRGRGRSPSVKLLRSGVPLVGHIAAGPLSEALESPEGYLKLPSHPDKFGLRIEGHSMADAIQHGDIVILKKRPHKGGDICAVRVDRSEATLKYLDLHPNHPERVLLRPHNPEYPTVELEAQRVAVDGVFAGLLRGEVIDDLMQGDVEMN